MTISLRGTTEEVVDIDYEEIVDSTLSIAPGNYTIGPLSGALVIDGHSMADRSVVRIIDPDGITNTHPVTLNFGTPNVTEIKVTSSEGVRSVVTMPIIINNGKANFELIRSGDEWILIQDQEGPSQTALQALVQTNDNRYKQHLIDLHSLNLTVRAVDTLADRDDLVPWDNTAPGFPITSAFFKITDAPDSTTALTQIRLTPNVPKTLYIIGPAINAATGVSVGGQVSGYEFVATLLNDVVSYVVGAAGGAIAGGYTDPETAYVGVAYDDLTAFSTSVFDAALIGEAFAAPQVSIVPDSQLLLGLVDADELLSEMAVGQAFHFHASGDVTLTSAQDIGEVTDGLAQIGPSPLIVPNGAQGYIKKNATGGLLVSYILAEDVESVIDLYEQLSTWTYTATNAGQPVTPLRSVVKHGKNAVVISDSSGGGWHFLANTENLPLTVSQKVFIEFAKIPADVTDPANPVLPSSVGIRMGMPGVVRDVVINPDTGEVVRTDVGIEVLSVIDTGDFFQVLIEYQPNGSYAYFHIYPAYGLNGAAGSNPSAQNELAISKLDMNYFGQIAEVEEEPDTRVLIMRQDVNTAAGLFTTAELTTDVNAGSSDPSSEIKYRDLSLVTEDFKDVNGAVTYELHYQEVTNNGGEDVIARFRQTSDLTETGSTQLEVVSNSVATTQFVGLSLGDGANSSFDGFNSTGFWWSIGIRTLHAGAIPINQAGNIYGNIASLYIVPLTEEQKAIKAAAAYMDKPVSVVYEVEASAENSSIQPAGNGLFVIQNQVENIPFDHASFDATTNAWTFKAPINYDLTISTQHYETRGVTGDATRVYHFRDVTTATGIVLGTSGEFGQNSAHTPASFVLPAGETITVDIRSASSGNNQILNERAKVIATVAASKEQLHAKPIDYYGYQPTALEINEYINNMVPYHAVLAHEAAGGNSKTVNVNGVGATFGNLLNATDIGNGVISFSGGTNSNFNRRGSTVESITKVGEYIEIITAATGQFDTQIITLSPDASVLAESHIEAANVNTEVLRLRLAGSGFTLLDGAGSTLASGGTENGTYRFTRTYFGWKVERNGVVIHESEEVCVNYNESTDAVISGNTGVYRIGVYEPPARIDINNTAFPTGFDLTQAGADQMHMVITASDTATGRQWQSGNVSIKPLIERFNAGDTVDTYVQIFDNDYLVLNVNDPATGDLQITDSGRQMAIEKIELWIVGEEGAALFALSNVTALATTGTFQNIGDANPLVIGDDGAAIYVEYGDASRDKFYFLDGIAKAERKGYSTSDLEFQILAGGQLQARDAANTSTIAKVWYEAPKRAIVLNTVAESVPSDTLPLFTSGLKTSFIDVGGRDATVLTDSGATTETAERAYDNLAYPFVEIEFVKDAAATNAFYLRPNGTGGVQSQVRMSLAGGTYDLHSSGTGAVDAKIVSIEENESTIKYLIDFSDSTAVFDALEIAPAGVDSAFTPSPAQTGSVSVIGVTLYASNPNSIDNLDGLFIASQAANDANIAVDYYSDSNNQDFQLQVRSTSSEPVVWRVTQDNSPLEKIPDLEWNDFTLNTSKNSDGTFKHVFAGRLESFKKIKIEGSTPSTSGPGQGALQLESKLLFV